MSAWADTELPEHSNAKDEDGEQTLLYTRGLKSGLPKIIAKIEQRMINVTPNEAQTVVEQVVKEARAIKRIENGDILPEQVTEAATPRP